MEKDNILFFYYDIRTFLWIKYHNAISFDDKLFTHNKYHPIKLLLFRISPRYQLVHKSNWNVRRHIFILITIKSEQLKEREFESFGSAEKKINLTLVATLFVIHWQWISIVSWYIWILNQYICHITLFSHLFFIDYYTSNPMLPLRYPN